MGFRSIAVSLEGDPYQGPIACRACARPTNLVHVGVSHFLHEQMTHGARAAVVLRGVFVATTQSPSGNNNGCGGRNSLCGSQPSTNSRNQRRACHADTVDLKVPRLLEGGEISFEDPGG